MALPPKSCVLLALIVSAVRVALELVAAVLSILLRPFGFVRHG